MSRKQELNKLIKNSMKKIDELNRELECLVNTELLSTIEFNNQNGYFKPAHEERYYFINDKGLIDMHYYNKKDSSYDDAVIKNNKTFKTNEACARYLDLVKTLKYASEEYDSSKVQFIIGINDELDLVFTRVESKTYRTLFFSFEKARELGELLDEDDICILFAEEKKEL